MEFISYFVTSISYFKVIRSYQWGSCISGSLFHFNLISSIRKGVTVTSETEESYRVVL